MDIKSILTSVTPIEEDAWTDFEQYFTKKKLRKNEKLWKTGEICKHLVFINYGLIRSYRYLGTKEISTHFFFEGRIFYDDYSFVSQNPCIDTYETLEETELIVIPRVAINLMYDKYKSFERLGRMIVENNHTALIEEHQNIKNLSSKEKYLNLISDKPDVLQRVPLKFIASYLNMTPEYLSKLRKELACSKT